MTYAGHRKIIDCDSHLIELDDFLSNAARAADLPFIPAMDAQSELPVVQIGIDRGRELLAKRQGDSAVMEKFESALLDNTKSGWNRLGAFDQAERSHTLDLFGFEIQLVLPTFSFHQIAHESDPQVLEAGARTMNRAMGDFCAKDERLRAIGYIPLSLGPEIAAQLMTQGFADGCYTFMVDTNEPDDEKISFTHPDFDPVWASFAAQGVPFVVHVAVNGHYKRMPDSFKRNGRSNPELGGDAPAGELGMMTINNSAEIFLSAMIFDNVFDRHPKLRGVSMEHGAFWVPSWLHALDFTARTFRHKREFAELPSQVAKRHLKISPFAGEPVGWIIENVGPEMLVFASDYPHPEGTNDPIKRFEATMQNCNQVTMGAFYHGNMASVMGINI